MSTTVLNPSSTDQTTHPQPWCTEHDDNLDVCFSTRVNLTDDTAPVWGDSEAGTVLASSDDGVSVTLVLGSCGHEVTIGLAERFAYAILTQICTARGDKAMAEAHRAFANGGTR